MPYSILSLQNLKHYFVFKGMNSECLAICILKINCMNRAKEIVKQPNNWEILSAPTWSDISFCKSVDCDQFINAGSLHNRREWWLQQYMARVFYFSGDTFQLSLFLWHVRRTSITDCVCHHLNDSQKHVWKMGTWHQWKNYQSYSTLNHVEIKFIKPSFSTFNESFFFFTDMINNSKSHALLYC